MTVTTDPSDTLLLKEYADQRSQDAFTELVSRHSAWVYSAAQRMVRDRHLAEDVTQAVFLILADKAGKLGSVPLHRWLFKVTRYASANAIRSRTRRDKYERRAAMYASEILEADPDKMWEEIEPVLDDLMSRLRSQDRDVLLMRFYQQKNMAEVATGLGVSEGAAKIRIVRAIEKLRVLLRRRGLVVPAVLLSTVLLGHTTQAAPVTLFKICIPAAATPNAIAVAKGASTMLVTAKIKLVVAVVLVMMGGAVPVGTWAYRVATAAPALAPVPVQSPAPAEAAAPPAVIPDAGPVFDPRLAPYVTDRTDIIVAVDVDKIDLDAIAADIHKELVNSKTDAATAAKIDPLIQMGEYSGKLWINGFKKAGGTTMFLLSRSDELQVGPAAGPSNMKMTAEAIYPTDSTAAARSLANYLTRAGSAPLKIEGNTVVDGATSASTPQVGDASDSRPALAAGLAAASDAPIRVALNPARLKEIIPKFMAAGHISANFPSDEWDGVQWVSIKVVLPPAEFPMFECVSHYKDSATAEIAKTKSSARMNKVFSGPQQTGALQSKDMMKFVQSEKFAIKDSDLVMSMDLHAYWDLIFSAVGSAAGQIPAAAPRTPQGPTN